MYIVHSSSNIDFESSVPGWARHWRHGAEEKHAWTRGNWQLWLSQDQITQVSSGTTFQRLCNLNLVNLIVSRMRTSDRRVRSLGKGEWTWIISTRLKWFLGALCLKSSKLYICRMPYLKYLGICLLCVIPSPDQKSLDGQCSELFSANC